MTLWFFVTGSYIGQKRKEQITSSIVALHEIRNSCLLIISLCNISYYCFSHIQWYCFLGGLSKVLVKKCNVWLIMTLGGGGLGPWYFTTALSADLALVVIMHSYDWTSLDTPPVVSKFAFLWQLYLALSS